MTSPPLPTLQISQQSFRVKRQEWKDVDQLLQSPKQAGKQGWAGAWKAATCPGSQCPSGILVPQVPRGKGLRKRRATQPGPPACGAGADSASPSAAARVHLALLRARHPTHIFTTARQCTCTVYLGHRLPRPQHSPGQQTLRVALMLAWQHGPLRPSTEQSDHPFSPEKSLDHVVPNKTSVLNVCLRPEQNAKQGSKKGNEIIR